MDGGIVEAAALGALMGGGASAVTGGDPLKGALLGGLTGGLGTGISGAIADGGGISALLGGGATPAAASALAPEAVTSSLAATAPEGLAAAANAGVPSSLASTVPTSIAPSAMPIVPQASGFVPSIPNAVSSVPQASLFSDPLAYMKQHQFLAGTTALAGATGARNRNLYTPEVYSGPLSKFHYNPATYIPSTPGYAEGGGINTLTPDIDVGYDTYAQGGTTLGSYSDGGRMLKGPGDGMSDDIPATIGGHQPARLADGEFVIPADVVSHLGNGSTDAGAKQLYNMMDRVRKARTGNEKQGKQINPGRYMAA